MDSCCAIPVNCRYFVNTIHDYRDLKERCATTCKGNERKKNEEYLYSAIYTTHSLKALRHGSHSLTCKLHHACLSFVSVHQMAPPRTDVADIQLQLTTHLSTPKGWKAELAYRLTTETHAYVRCAYTLLLLLYNVRIYIELWFSFFSTKLSDWMERTSLKWPYFCVE